MATKEKKTRTKKADPTPSLGGRGGLACRVGREALAQAVGWAKGAVKDRTVKEALRSVEVEGHADHTVTVRATDLSTGARLTLAGTVTTPGKWLFSPDRLVTVLENSTPDECELDCGPAGAELRCGGRFEFPAPDDPDLGGCEPPAGKEVRQVDLADAADLLLAFRSVRWAAAADGDKGATTRPVMRGVWVGAGDGGKLTLMASDAKYAGVCPVGGAECPAGLEAVVPVGPLDLFLKEAVGPVSLSFGRTLACFRSETVEVVCQQLAGEYPSAVVSRAVTLPAAGWAEVESEGLYRAVRAAAAGLSGDLRTVEVSAGSDACLVVRAAGGGAEVVVPVIEWGGDQLDGAGVVRIDPARLLRAERVADRGRVRVEVPSPVLARVVLAGGAVLAFAQIGEAE